MRMLTRNKIRIFYANYHAKTPLKDEYGNLTGEYKVTYDNPVAVMANVSAARGESTTRQFGEDESYDRIIVLDDPKFPITATSILWIDTLPEITGNGSTHTPYDHIVKRVAPSLNSLSIAVSRVSITQSYLDLSDDGAGNISILSNAITVSDDGTGNVCLRTGVM